MKLDARPLLVAGALFVSPSLLCAGQSDVPEPAPVTLSGTYIVDVSTTVRAADGRFDRGVRARGLANLAVTFEVQPHRGWAGTFSAQMLAKSGGDGRSLLLDQQGFSNIDTDNFAGVGELWYEQRLPGEHVRIKAGRVDANVDFASNEHAADFLNSSMGFSPTIFMMPTYPHPTFGGNVSAAAGPVSGGIGVYRPSLGDGPDNMVRAGDFLVAELAFSWHRQDGPAHGKVTVGRWNHSGSFTRTDGAVRSGTDGVYAMVDDVIWSGGADEHAPSVAMFAQVGLADRAVSPFSRHVGLGLTRSGVGARRDDHIGVGATWVRFGDQGSGAHELAVGPFYRVQARSWLAIQPDVQLVTSTTARPRVALTWRAVTSF